MSLIEHIIRRDARGCVVTKNDDSLCLSCVHAKILAIVLKKCRVIFHFGVFLM
jgi:hypothetical protein